MENNNILINKFTRGVNTDIAEDAIPNEFLSNGHNIKLTNDDSKQGIIQKQEGYIKKLDGYDETLIPLAAKMFDNVIYIISYNTTTPHIEYGTYPSADLTTRILVDNKQICDKVYSYAPLPNYKTGAYAVSSIEYLEGFKITAAIETSEFLKFGYNEESIVDIEIQNFYDGSVNIISVADNTKPRIVNSRQNFSDTQVEIIVRNDYNLDNVYCNDSIEKTLLIPEIGDLVPVLIFDGVVAGAGSLTSGGYNYYFRLKTADGIESAIIEESRLVSIHTGTKFGKSKTFIDDTVTTNAAAFSLLQVDSRIYKYISVYYTRSTGSTEEVMINAYHIDKNFEIVNGTCSIIHTGTEKESVVDISEVTQEYSPINSAKTVTQKNNRLILGGTKTLHAADPLLQTAALCCYVEEIPLPIMYVEQSMADGSTVRDDSYASPYNIYHRTTYFPGETYELAINFVYRSGKISDAYPIMGHDWESGTAFNLGLLGTKIGFVTFQNSEGVVRMRDTNIKDSMYDIPANTENHAEMNVITMIINTTKMVTDHRTALEALGIRSYFISRRKRRPDMLMEGLLTTMGQANKTAMNKHLKTHYTFGSKIGYYAYGELTNNLVHFPAPGRAIPFSSESVWDGNGDANPFASSFDGILHSKLPMLLKNFALYSPDITCDEASMAVSSLTSDQSLFLEAVLTQGLGITALHNLNHTTTYTKSANPYRFTTVPTTQSITNIVKIQYVGDAKRSFTSNSYTSKLDRQVALVLRHSLFSTNASAGSNVNSRALQLAQVTSAGNDYVSHTDYSVTYGEGVAAKLLLTGVNYSPYMGIELTHNSGLDALLNPATDMYFTAFIAGEQYPLKTTYYPLGLISRIYLNPTGQMLTPAKWRSKYSNSTGDYFAISERFLINKSLSSTAGLHSGSYLKGGDCYSGFYFQQAWRPGGIDGIPTANDPSAYIFGEGGAEPMDETREGVNITNSGYAIGFPVRSKYNFALRAEEKVDDAELQLYGKHRTYTSGAPSDLIQGNRQAETSVINYGNIIHDSVLKFSKFDDTIPYLKLDYNNRLIVSDVATTNEFENSYRNFKGLNFKDYDEELGIITAIVSHGVHVYIIYTDGVSLIETSERSAMTSESSNTNVYIGSMEELPPKSTPVFSNVGAQHLKAVLATSAGVFGVDANTKKIWLLNEQDAMIISDATIQTTLNSLITADLKNVITSYDDIFNEVTFVFEYSNDTQKSLLYNTKFSIWYGTTDIHKFYQFNIENETLSLQKHGSSPVYSLYYPVINTVNNSLFLNVGKTTAIDDLTASTKTTYESYVEFVVRHEQAVKFDLSNIIINGTGVPSAIEVITDNIEPYTIDTAATSVTGIVQQTLPVHTNVYMQDADTTLTYLDEYRFERIRSSNFKTLAVDDKLTIDLDGTLQQFTIANVMFDGTDTDTIVLSHAMVNSTINAVYYGWKIPMRISLGECMAGKTKLTIPSKKHADLLKGVTQTDQNYHVNYANARPHGRWVKLKLYFEGIDQIYIESIMSEVSLRYS